jgi:AraC-like DNA-binding protein
MGPALAEFTHRALSRRLGCTPLELLTRLRVEEAARRLAADPSLDVTRVALDLGFCSSQYFATVFRRTLGISPSAWRESPRR